MGQGKFPKLVHLSPRCRAWRKADLDAHFGLTGDNRWSTDEFDTPPECSLNKTHPYWNWFQSN